MKPEMLAGGLLGSVVAALAVVLGTYIKSVTTVSTHNTDDRGKNVQDLMKQLADERVMTAAQKVTIGYLERREISLMRVLTNIGGDFRSLSDLVQAHASDLESEVLSWDILRRRARSIQYVAARIEEMMRREDEAMQKEYGSALTVPSPSLQPALPPPQADALKKQ